MMFPFSVFDPLDCENYYRDMAPYVLPYLKGRPLSLLRFSDDGYFYLHRGKDLPETLAATLGLMPDDLITCPDENAFEQLLSLQTEYWCLGFFLWSARLENQDQPDWLSWKLCAGKRASRSEFYELGQAFFHLLEKTGQSVFLKSSGGSGTLSLDFLISNDGHLNYENANCLAIQKAKDFIQEYSGELNLLKTPDADLRNTKSFSIYAGGNQWGHGILAPYSFMARNREQSCFVSIPLSVDDLNGDLQSFFSEVFTTRLLKERLDRYGDLWKNLL